MTRILVAYASKHHSTAEIADAIGEVLRHKTGAQVDVRSVETVNDAAPYDVVVVGSAVYMGQWQHTATDFLKRYERELSERPVWLFSSGPTGQGDPATLLRGWEFPEALQATALRIKPRGIGLFHGKLDPDELNFIEQAAIKLVHAEMGDFRDWAMIRLWAEQIVEALEAQSVETR
jgi:menaquinone-dependent protoporphyrinogen oxidase